MTGWIYSLRGGRGVCVRRDNDMWPLDKNEWNSGEVINLPRYHSILKFAKNNDMIYPCRSCQFITR